MAGVAVKLVFVFIILFAAVVIIDHYRPEGEPFSLVTGVSIWPGEALRLVAIILSVYFISKSLYDLRKNEKELCKDFGLHELMTPAPVTFTKWRKSKKGTKRSKSLLVNWLSYRRWNDIYGWKANKTEVYVQRLWKEYLIRGIEDHFHEGSGTDGLSRLDFYGKNRHIALSAGRFETCLGDRSVPGQGRPYFEETENIGREPNF